MINIEIGLYLRINIYFKNNILKIKVNDKIIPMDNNIKIENRKYYILKTYFFIERLEEISEKIFLLN